MIYTTWYLLNLIPYIIAVDTFGVQSVSITDTTDNRVCLQCVFSSFSTDSGCTVVLVSTTDQQQQYNGTFNRVDDTASGSITGVTTGVYNIRAFDQGSNVVAVELLSVPVTGEPSSTINITTNIIPIVTPHPDGPVASMCYTIIVLLILYQAFQC